MTIQLVRSLEQYKLDFFEKELIRICAPLFKCSEIIFFQYDKVFLDRSRVTLTTNSAWLYDFYGANYYKEGLYHKDIRTYQNGYNLWNYSGRPYVIDLARDKFDIDNGFTIIQRTENICEFYHFASRAGDRQVINFYMNNFVLLKRFIMYFKNEASHLIRNCQENKIQYYLENEKQENNQKMINDRINFLRKISFPRYYFHMNNSDNYLTKTEIKVGLWMLEGKSAEEIAKVLNISSRTVEGHITSMMNKFNCYKQTKVVQNLLHIGFDEIINFSD